MYSKEILQTNGNSLLIYLQAIRVDNRPSVTWQMAKQTAEIFNFVLSHPTISETKDNSFVCLAIFKSSSSTIDVHFE